ncbi:hypothetical protein ONZ43_g5642 [Nemania bipapillata]|uniref:Uncharacterized protein n=1 Tax=Nemania bipapillata TaxID=110536 RepID=A0ACC2I852_9PEZI|nr:hypothetical protein ONZ43_g5642 [Nemania bipapillata]
MGLPSIQKALVVVGKQEAGVVTDRPLPALRDHHLLVKVVSVALNVADWRHIDFYSSPGALLGFDYSGIVEETGKDVTRFAKGDRVCGLAHGGNARQNEEGAFAEYIIVIDHAQIHIPKNLSFQEAATLGVGLNTAGLSLYQYLKLKTPSEPVSELVSVLVYGGSTATGSLAIQLAKLSGYHVVTTCSPHNFEFVRGLGADWVCDYRDPGAGTEIRKLTGDKLKIVFDTISTELTAKFCAEAISSEGGAYASLLPIEVPRSNVTSKLILGYTVFGQDFELGGHPFAAVPEDKDFATCFFPLVGEYLERGKLKVHPPSVREGGLEGILQGLDLLRNGQISAQKLVYNVSEDC